MVAKDQVRPVASHNHVPVRPRAHHRARHRHHALDDRIHHDLAVLATDHDVVPIPRRNLVAPAMVRIRAEDPVDVQRVHVVARQTPTHRRRRRIHPRRIRRRPVDVAAVAQHDVVRIRPAPARVLPTVGHDHVLIDPAQDDVPPHARRNRVRTPNQRFDRLHQTQRHRERAKVRGIHAGGRDLSVVTENKVVAVASVNDVPIRQIAVHSPHDVARAGKGAIPYDLAILAAQDDVVAGPSGEEVVSTMVGIGAEDPVDVGAVVVVDDVIDISAIAEDDVVALARMNLVAIDPAKHDVVAVSRVDDIVASHQGVDCEHTHRLANDALRPVARTTTA